MLLQDIKSELDKARKSKSSTISILSLIYSNCLLIGKEKGNTGITDESIITLLNKMKKNTEETKAQAISSSREEMVKQCDNELAVLNKFLPSQLDKTDLTRIIEVFISENKNTNIGMIMKYLKSKYSGQYDGKLASEIVKGLLK